MAQNPFLNENHNDEPQLQYDFPAEAIFERELNDADKKLIILQWNLFNELKNEDISENPLIKRIEHGDKPLLQGTLIHGTAFDLDKVTAILHDGILSGELVGIPEDNETHYCADFFRVPEDYSIEDYLKWCATPVSSGFLKIKRGEFNYIPTLDKPSHQIAFIADTTNARLAGLLENDPYTPDGYEKMQHIVNYLFREVDSAETRTTSAVLCGIPAKFISGVIISDDFSQEEIDQLKMLVGSNRVVFNTHGEIL